ncbi:ParB/RepB/Spo0J family partition protein [Acetivibrio cellulolyticus]|uniref:ParB/RepB/Spo0J family partition protein n=1 Tax=Acetivibrio cellulolyticus TaxID=35830 RepID=UPI0001E2D1A2|nr:ParB/RepB/Spo0J family partition protein [Acetivibrio cellulolyticus]
MVIKIKDIIIKDRLRKADPKKVEELAQSIKLLGLLQPIVLNKRNELLAGLNRLEAHKLLNLEEIKFEYLDHDDILREELAELDENLVRSDFHYLDRGIYLMRKKEIYDELNNTNTISNNCDGLKVKPFTEFIAEKTNQSQRTIQNEIKIAKDIIPDLKEQIKENNIGFAKAIEISRLDKDAQKNVLEKLKAGDSSILNTTVPINISCPLAKSNTIENNKTEVSILIQSLRSKLLESFKNLSQNDKAEMIKNIKYLIEELTAI